MGRAPAPLSALPDLPSPLPAVATGRRHGAAACGAGPGFGAARPDQAGRVLCGWQFQRGQKGGAGVGKTKRGKGCKVMAIADRAGLPVALSTASAAPHETTFVRLLITGRLTTGKPRKLIGDKAYDSDPLDETCRTLGVELIAPHRKNRTKPRSQDGRKLRRYRRRWKIERLFAWLQNYRRLVTRYEHYAANFLAFLQLAAFLILAKKYL